MPAATGFAAIVSPAHNPARISIAPLPTRSPVRTWRSRTAPVASTT
jgi:hypothetical protein